MALTKNSADYYYGQNPTTALIVGKNVENCFHGNFVHSCHGILALHEYKKLQLMEVNFKKCGVRLSPPCFIVIYQTGEKLRRKIMPLRQFKSNSDVEFVATELKNRHRLEEVPLVKIEKLLRLLQELQKGLDKSEAVQKIEREFKIKVNEDLNKLSIRELEIQKKLMDSIFLKNQIKKDDQDFVYDKQIDFFSQKESSNWDSDTDNFWD